MCYGFLGFEVAKLQPFGLQRLHLEGPQFKPFLCWGGLVGWMPGNLWRPVAGCAARVLALLETFLLDSGTLDAGI